MTALQIIPRASWGAVHEAGDGPAPLPAEEVWYHHSVTVAPDLAPPFDDEDAAMRQLEAIGESRFGRGVSYTFAVMPTGRVFEGHGVNRLGAHTAKRNSRARAIVLVGNYDTDEVTAAQVEATAQLLMHGVHEGWWRQARLDGGHQQVPGAATACPGRHAMAVIGAVNARAAELLGGGRPAPAHAPAAPASHAPAPAAPAGRATLRRGAKGDLVRQLQQFLNRNYPAYSKLAADGDFGPGTERVVKEFQRRSGLAADGVVGPRTWALIRL